MICTNGEALIPEIKQAIVALKEYFDRNKSLFMQQDSSVQMVADAFDIGIATVNRVMSHYHKNPNSIYEHAHMKGKPSYSISDTNKEAVRAYVRQANLEGVHITLESIQNFLHEKSPDEEFHITTLGKTLGRWGFEFGKGKRTQHLKEKDYVIAARRAYLRRMRNNRCSDGEASTVRPEVYLDESYINKNHSTDYTWYYGEDGPWIKKPIGKGERLIIMNAITCSGWVPNAKNIFKSSRKTGDYHGSVDAELFQRWFSEILLPNIPDNSLIIMDNAAYHNELDEDSPPTEASKKEEIIRWLEKNGHKLNQDLLKVELVELLNKNKPDPIYTVDKLAKKRGHEVIRTPPYHPELQPIERCWAIVKNEVARHNDFAMKTMTRELEKAFEKINAINCQGIIKEVRKIEDKFWREDALLERRQEEAENRKLAKI